MAGLSVKNVARDLSCEIFNPDFCRSEVKESLFCSSPCAFYNQFKRTFFFYLVFITTTLHVSAFFSHHQVCSLYNMRFKFEQCVKITFC